MRPGGIADDRHVLRLAGLALPAAVWLLGILSPPKTGLSPIYVASLTGLLAGLAIVDATLPSSRAATSRRLLWLAAELAISFLIVQVQPTLIRGSLIYLLPASRALLLFGERPGLPLSLGVWLAYGLNVGIFAWPDKLTEFVNYFSFLLPLYVVAVVLTLATIRQAADRQRLQSLYDALSTAHAELQALHARARKAAVTEERNRIAREIHDSVAHYLTVVNVQLEAAEKLGVEQPERAGEHVRRARRLALDCLREVRRSVGALRTASLEELSLPRALDKLTSEFARSTGIDVRLEVALPDDPRLTPATAQTLYRTAQEGLTNVQRHARAQSVRISLQRANRHVELAVQDDGVGPSNHASDEGNGFGLLGLRERVALLGGELAFGPAGPRGSRLSVSVPIGP